MDWSKINEKLIRVHITLQGYNLVIIGQYASPIDDDDERFQIKDRHDNNLNQVLETIKNRNEIILVGDFNAHVSNKRNDIVVESYRKNEVNNNRQKLLELSHQYSLQIKNGFYKHEVIHKYTCFILTQQQK